MPLFLSTHVNKVDKKGRVSVPAAYRSALVGQGWEGVICLPSLVYPALEGCDLAYMENLSTEQSQGMQAFGRSKDAFSSAVFAAARQLSFDSEGRIILPENFMKHAGITEFACFVGQGPTFQVWEPTRFEAHQKEAWDTLSADQRTGGGQ